jgi:alginate export protein
MKRNQSHKPGTAPNPERLWPSRGLIKMHWVLLLCTARLVLPGQGQSPPPAAPTAGLLNDFLREQNPAFTNWDIGGQGRVRFEGKSGIAVPGAGAGAVDFSKATPDNNYWLFREKIHAGWRPCSWVSFYGEGRDSSSWNDKRRPEPEEDSMDLHQGWVMLGNPQEFPVTAKVGRQELIYGDERLVGAFDWNNIGRVFDAATLRYGHPDLWVDAFTSRVVLINDGEFNVANDYDWFSGVYSSTRTLVPKQETQLYFLARNTSPQSPIATTGSPQPGGPTARDIYTFGLRIQSLPGQFGPWDYDGEFAGQFGDFYDTTLGRRLEHRAFAAHVAGGYTWKETRFTPRAGLEYNFATGDGDPADNEHGTFENLFPTNHKFYGIMDFFSWQNLHDVRLNASARPVKNLTVTADYHLFWLAETADYFYSVSGLPRTTGGYGRQRANDSFAGSELDLVASYKVGTLGVLQVGYGHFFRGGYVKESLTATGSNDADWVYVQAVLNF